MKFWYALFLALQIKWNKPFLFNKTYLVEIQLTLSENKHEIKINLSLGGNYLPDSYGPEIQVLSILAFIALQTHFRLTMPNLNCFRMQKSLWEQKAPRLKHRVPRLKKRDTYDMRNFLEFYHCMAKKAKITAIKTHLSYKLQSFCFLLDLDHEGVFNRGEMGL